MKKILFILLFSLSTSAYSLANIEDAYLSCSSVVASTYPGGSCELQYYPDGIQGDWIALNSSGISTGNFYHFYSACSVNEEFNLSSGSCELIQCSEIGFDPTLWYLNGFCPNAPSVGSSDYTQCLSGEVTHNVPPCQLVQCPDGSIVTSGVACPLPKQCWDGSVVYGDDPCPNPSFICPDGSQVTSQEFCPKPNEDNKTCWDGSIIPISTACPPQDDDPNTFQCYDGSKVADIANCPPPSNPTPSDVNNTATSTSTTTSTSTNTTTNESTTSVSNTTTTTEINLDATNSRLDTIDKTLSDFFDPTSGPGLDANFDGSSTDQVINQFGTDFENERTGVKNGVLGSSDILEFNPIFPESTCTSIGLNHKFFSYTFDPCPKLGIMRSMLGWFFYMLTAIYIFKLFTRKSGES